MKIVDYQYLIIINQILDYLALCSVVGHCQLLIKGSAISFIDVWMPFVRDKIENKSVKKTLTIPKWLNDIAVERKVNFSQVLQNGLKDYLGINK